MATLQSTTVNGNLTANTSFTSPLQITTTNSQVYKEYTGTVSIPSSVNNPVNYVNLFANVGVHGGPIKVNSPVDHLHFN